MQKNTNTLYWGGTADADADADADLYQPHWGSMGDRLGGDDLAGVNLATPSWVTTAAHYFPYIIDEDDKENAGEVMWSSSSKCEGFGTTPGGAGVVGLDDADYGDDGYGAGCDGCDGATSADLTSPLLTSPNSNLLGFHIVHDNNDCRVFGPSEGDGDDYSYAAAARAGRQEYSDDDNGFNRDDAYKADPYW